MINQILAKQFAMNARSTDMNLDGVTHENSLFQPPNAGNCVNWIVGHILANRNPVHKLIGLDPAWAAGTERYDRGTEPITDATDAVPLDSMLALFRSSQEAVAAALDAVEDAALTATPGTGDGVPVGIQLASLAFHESYHVGQLGLLRRLLQLDPAIT